MTEYHEELYRIYEFEQDGIINKESRNMLITIFEMKTRNEYVERKFKERFNFKPIKCHPNKGFITVDNEQYMVDIGRLPGAVIVRDNGHLGKVNRQALNITIGGEIVLDMNAMLKMKNKDRMDAILYHEIGHNKFQGVTQDPKNYKNIINHDNTLSETIIDEIIDANRRQRTKPNMSDIHRKILEKWLQDLRNYLIVKLSNSQPDLNKQKLREEAIKYLKKFECDGHTNFKEFEADIYASMKTNTKAVTKSMREYNKKAEISKFATPKDKVKSINDMAQRRKVLRDKTARTYNDVYK